MSTEKSSKSTGTRDNSYSRKRNSNSSEVFENERIGGNNSYYEIISKDKKRLKLIFTSDEEINRKVNSATTKINGGISELEEIIFIFDFNKLSVTLDLNKLESLLKLFLDFFKTQQNTPNISIIIQNCLIEDKEYEPLFKDEMIVKLNKLEISDELYSFSPYLKTLFSNFKTNELVLKKFKFSSKAQLKDFSEFILKSSCNKLTLDDFFIELIIKKDENDEGYNDLDIYFSLLDNFISINHTITDINSLTLKDCPLFAIIGDIFSNNSMKKYINIDQNSLLNPGIITKFKMENGRNDICFDLDYFKIRLKEEGKLENFDYVDCLYYIFSILIPSFKKNKTNSKKEDDDIDDIEDSGVRNISPNDFHKLIFKNFDTTKFEYITGDDITYIDEKEWVLNEEEEGRKKRFELFAEKIEKIGTKVMPQIKELVFDNCSNFFIDWILTLFRGPSIVTSDEYHFDKLKIKKCGNGYVNLSMILKMKIRKLILFDTPLIVGDSFPENGEKHLKSLLENKLLGTVDYLTIKTNSLDFYGREYDLNIMKTYEILLEIIECGNYYSNLIFEMNALSDIMTYLAYKTYVKNQSTFNNPNREEKGLDEINPNDPEGKDLINDFEEDTKYLPKYIFLSSKNYRDYLCSQSFKINLNSTAPLTIKNTVIRKCYENYENQNYLLYKIQHNKNKIDATNKKLRKIDFGSDGFYIERDYKYFFYENNIKQVKLENVAFSNFKDNNIEPKNSREFETINNLIGKNIFGDSIKKYNKMTYPNYIMDMKTFKGIFCVNYGYEDVTAFFKHLNNILDKEEEKKVIKSEMECIKKTFDKFKENIKELCVIIKSIKEQKEFYCLAVILDYLISEQANNDIKSIKFHDFRALNKIHSYFIWEKNENERNMFSDFNYYNKINEEEKMEREKKIKIGNYLIKIDSKINEFEEYI